MLLLLHFGEKSFNNILSLTLSELIEMNLILTTDASTAVEMNLILTTDASTAVPSL